MTTNRSKFAEVSSLLHRRGIDVEQLNVSYPEVQADHLRDVVLYALEWLAPRYGDDLLIDDSGLFIEALKGFPGVYSSYVYRTIGCRGVLTLLHRRDRRNATFEACFGLLRDGVPHVFEGRCRGTITTEERGTGGFGFDPIFVPEGDQRTFAEMSMEEKNAVSHRGRAVEELIQFLVKEA